MNASLPRARVPGSPDGQPEASSVADPTLAAWASEMLEQAGLGATRPRTLVLGMLRHRARPVTAQELHAELTERLHSEQPGAKPPGLTTIYRVLAVLASHGLLHSFHRDPQTTAYRLCQPRDHHLHLMCRRCGLVRERPAPPLNRFLATPAADDGFTIESYQAELVGLCATCQPDSVHRA
jgi:Fe2+ or Zn2+ uptake regulation protein